MVLKGQRLPSSEMVTRLSRFLGHDEREHRYLELLIEKERRELKALPVSETLKELKDLNKKKGGNQILIEANRFAYMSDWIHFVLRQLIQTRNFKEDYNWIATQLAGKVPVWDLRDAVGRMLKLGVLKRDPAGKLLVVDTDLTTTQDIPVEAVRNHVRQMILRGIEALQEIVPAQREISTVCLRFKKSDFEKARQEIRRFRDTFQQNFSSDDADSVFQINIQFFPHTRSKS